MKETGRVIRALGGAFTVLTDEGESYTCPAKGVLKRNDGRLLVGDVVSLRRSENEKASFQRMYDDVLFYQHFQYRLYEYIFVRL